MDQSANMWQNMAAEHGVSGSMPCLTKAATGVLTMADDDLSPDEGCAQPNCTEVWKPVPSEPGVLASSEGRILLPPRYAPLPNGGYRAYFPKPRYGQVSRATRDARHEYRIVMVKDGPVLGSRQRPRKVHQLVCEAFHGPKPFKGAVVIHQDENPHNNRPDNLRWGTQKENLNAAGFLDFCRQPMAQRRRTA